VTHSSTISAMTGLASRIIGTLDAEQRSRACFDFPDNEERRRFYWVPTDHGGLPLRDCEDGVQRLIMQLVASGLSPAGYNTAVTIISLQNILSRREGWGTGWPGGRPVRDVLEYQLSIFGEPSPTGSWAWRFGGHHLSLSYAVIDGTRVSSTPSFFGADPADTPLAGGALLRPLGLMEDLGRELVRSLDGQQLASAVIARRAPSDLVVGNQELANQLWKTPPERLFRDPSDEVVSILTRQMGEADAALGSDLGALRFTLSPKGIRAVRFRSDQREILESLLGAYIERLPDDVAGGEHAKVIGTSGDDLHFAWAGPVEGGHSHYYRIHGPRILIEYDNINGNHIHSAWRDPLGDFGGDALAHHWATEHR